MRSLFLIVSCLVGCSDYEILKPNGTGRPDDTSQPSLPYAENWQEDLYTVEGAAGVDVIFFGDTSGSMQPELKTLGANITDFVEHLALVSEDWHLLAVTGPTGCGVGGVFTVNTPDFATAFSQAIVTPPGEDLVDEWGLYDTTAAVEATDAGDCNEGFLREDSPLQIIVISDEPDSSPDYKKGGEYWRQYVDAVLAKKGGMGTVVYSAVAGPVPKGCDGALPGTGYDAAVAATGGEFISICDAWYEQLGILAEAVTHQAEFPLSQWPVLSTLFVSVNGVVRTEGWIYDEVANSVVFEVDIPISGNSVRLLYELAEPLG